MWIVKKMWVEGGFLEKWIVLRKEVGVEGGKVDDVDNFKQN